MEFLLLCLLGCMLAASLSARLPLRRLLPYLALGSLAVSAGYFFVDRLW